MEEYIIKNPFVGCTARDMKFDEVKKYWCSPFVIYHLSEDELFTSTTPIIIEGIRGSGKTMILKYLSYNVQKIDLNDKSIEYKLDYLRKRSFGIYFRYKEDICNIFNNMKCPEYKKEKAFKNYYELCVARELIDSLSLFYDGAEPEELIKVISEVLSEPVKSLLEAEECIHSHITRLDDAFNNSDYDDEWIDNSLVGFKFSNIIKDLIDSITNKVPGWENILFVLLLDEYENLGSLKRVVNTLIKQVDDSLNLSYRVGMRPAGLELDNSTYIGNEKLQVDRDYLYRPLEYDSFTAYKKFAAEIAKRRLQDIDAFNKKQLTNIRRLLGEKEDFDEEAKEVAKEKKQFEPIKEYMDIYGHDAVVSALSNQEKLLEMYNILQVIRGNDYREISEVSRMFLDYRGSKKKINKNDGKVYKYYLDYSSKYRLALLFLLHFEYGIPKYYYSFNTFLYLSSGSINDFISLCRNTFRYIDSDVFSELLSGKTIPISLQTKGAFNTALAQKMKLSQSNTYGAEMLCFIENLGRVFERYHEDRKVRYPETNQFAFTDEGAINNNSELKKVLIELINSGAIIKRKKRQHKTAGKTRGTIYQINRIYAPVYDFSYRTRGGVNYMIKPEQFGYMFRNEIDLNSVLKDYSIGYRSDSSRQNQDKKNKADNQDNELSDKQITMFDKLTEGEV